MCGNEGQIFHLRQADLNAWNF